MTNPGLCDVVELLINLTEHNLQTGAGLELQAERGVMVGDDEVYRLAE